MPPGAQLLGREWLGFDGEIATVRFEAQPLFTNRHGTIQGGFLAAMLDSATGLGALAALPATRTVVTRTLTTRFLKPARIGPITAKAKVILADRPRHDRGSRSDRRQRCDGRQRHGRVAGSGQAIVRSPISNPRIAPAV
ncbi:PaaI family thioesterase [Bradyrhizobium sp. 13971]